LQSERKDFEDQRGALLAKAVLDAKAQGEQLMISARRAAESQTSKQNAALLAEAADVGDRLTRLAAAESLRIARSALKDLADTDLEERISGVFAHRLRGMDTRTKEAFGLSLKRSDGGPVVASSFDLSDHEKTTIQTALNETFSADIPLRFETSSQGIAGIELNSGGQRLSWTLGDYLTGLEEKVAALLKAGTLPAGVAPLPAAEPTGSPLGPPAPSVPVPQERVPAAAA
jgi:F-type H+-transporting ATPase subunit b